MLHRTGMSESVGHVWRSGNRSAFRERFRMHLVTCTAVDEMHPGAVTKSPHFPTPGSQPTGDAKCNICQLRCRGKVVLNSALRPRLQSRPASHPRHHMTHPCTRVPPTELLITENLRRKAPPMSVPGSTNLLYLLLRTSSRSRST